MNSENVGLIPKWVLAHNWVAQQESGATQYLSRNFSASIFFNAVHAVGEYRRHQKQIAGRKLLVDFLIVVTGANLADRYAA